jgi:hypothetical protein
VVGSAADVATSGEGEEGGVVAGVIGGEPARTLGGVTASAAADISSANDA